MDTDTCMHGCAIESASRRSHHGNYGDAWRLTCTCGLDELHPSWDDARRAMGDHLDG